MIKIASKDLWKIIQEEIESNVVWTGAKKAVIPVVRKAIRKRTGEQFGCPISDQTIDNFLEQAWKNQSLKLELGAPIGEYDVKYLITNREKPQKDQRKFYYVEKVTGPSPFQEDIVELECATEEALTECIEACKARFEKR